jgi:predicted nucleotidyltransferase
MPYGLPPHTIQAIQGIFAAHPQVARAILYGSRAKGTQHPNSDIDLVLQGPELDLTTQFKIENELDDLLLPYQIDLSLYHQINNPDLIDHIERVGQVFWEKEAGEDSNASRTTGRTHGGEEG